MNLPDSGYQPDSEFKIRPDPDTGYQIPISESDWVKNQNFLIHCSLVITRNLGSKGLHVIEIEGFCYDRGGDLYIAVNDII